MDPLTYNCLSCSRLPQSLVTSTCTFQSPYLGFPGPYHQPATATLPSPPPSQDAPFSISPYLPISTILSCSPVSLAPATSTLLALFCLLLPLSALDPAKCSWLFSLSLTVAAQSCRQDPALLRLETDTTAPDVLRCCGQNPGNRLTASPGRTLYCGGLQRETTSFHRGSKRTDAPTN